MADTKQPEITDEMRSLAEQHNLSPADLLKLPDYIELARKLGVELKDLLVNDNSSAISGQPAQVHTWFSFGIANVAAQLSPGEYTVHAWLPAELGGDDVNGTLTI